MSKLTLVENELSLSPSAWKFVFGLLSKKQIEEVTRLDPRKWENLSQNSELWMALYGAAFREHTQQTHLSVDRTTLRAIGSHQFTIQPSLAADADAEIVHQLAEHQKSALRKFQRSSESSPPRTVVGDSAWLALFGWEWNRMLHLYTHDNKVVDFEYPSGETPLLALHLDFEHTFHPSTGGDLEDELELSIDVRKKTSVSLAEYTVLERLFRGGLGLTLQYETDAGGDEAKSGKGQKRVVVTEMAINAAGKPVNTSSPSPINTDGAPRLEITFFSNTNQLLEIRLQNDAFLLHHSGVMDIAVLLTEKGLPHAERRLRYGGRGTNLKSTNFPDAQLLPSAPTVRHEMAQSQPNQLISDILLVEDHHRAQAGRFTSKAAKPGSKTSVRGAPSSVASAAPTAVVLEKTVYEMETPSTSAEPTRNMTSKSASKIHVSF